MLLLLPLDLEASATSYLITICGFKWTGHSLECYIQTFFNILGFLRKLEWVTKIARSYTSSVRVLFEKIFLSTYCSNFIHEYTFLSSTLKQTITIENWSCHERKLNKKSVTLPLLKLAVLTDPKVIISFPFVMSILYLFFQTCV